jgi:hypothetical protein
LLCFVLACPSLVASQTLERVSVGGTGTQRPEGGTAEGVSADGRFVLFSSGSGSVGVGDQGPPGLVYLLDRSSGTVEAISDTVAAPDRSNGCEGLAMSVDARRVVFVCAGGTRARVRSIFLWERGAALRYLSSAWQQVWASLSADGAVVAYATGESLRVRRVDAPATANACDRGGEASEYLSHDRYMSPVLNGTGTVVIVADEDAKGASSVVRAIDCTTGAERVVSQDERGSSAGRYCHQPSLSSDGSTAAFTCSDVGRLYVTHLATSALTEIRSGGRSPRQPSLDASGTMIALVDGQLDERRVLLHDRTTNRTRLVSRHVPFTAGYAGSFSPRITADGQSVAFSSRASNLVAGDTNTQTDAFLAVNGGRGCDYDVWPVSIALPAVETSLTPAALVGWPRVDTWLDCQWQATSWAPWLSIIDAGVRTGSGTLAIRAEPNTGSGRSGTANVAGRSISVQQAAGVAPCQPSLRSPNTAVAAAGGSLVVDVTADCAWSATTDVPWIVFIGPASGGGNGQLSYTVGANPATEPRSGVIRIGAAIHRVTQSGTSSTVTHTRFFAEGATSAFFDTRVALVNPGDTASSVVIRFLRQGAVPIERALMVPARARRTIDPKTLGVVDAEFSMSIESSSPVVADRTMAWDASHGYGAHAETAIVAPASAWYLAEGSTVGGFSLFYLLQNPHEAQAEVLIRYLLPSGPAIEKTYFLPPQSRTNIWVNEEEFGARGRLLASTDVSAMVTSPPGLPIIVERAMYLNVPGQTFTAGHESAGVTALSTEWFLAEGATGAFFDLFVLVANPNGDAADIEVTFLLPDGSTVVKRHVVAPSSRFNIWVDQEDPALADTAVSTTVRSTNGVPVIVERAMWWPGTSSTWYEAHNSAGATATSARWALAEGEVGGLRNTDTYILVANTSPAAGRVRVTLLLEAGGSIAQEFDIPARSRFNVDVRSAFPGARGARFGSLVEALGDAPAQLVVERAMYWNAGGQVWAAGTNALATRLP